MSDVVERSMVTTLSKLPGDVLQEILSRIPATTLKRFKTTCKTWNGLFNDKGFGRKQFEKAEKQFLSLLLMKNYELALLRVRYGNFGPGIVLGADEIRLVGPNNSSASPSSRFGITDVVHCDGLLFVQSKTRVAVWNPVTGGQSRWIEKAKRHRNFGFGYYQSKNGSCRDKSYRILNFGSYGKSKDSAIYELDSDSWKVIDEVVPGSYDENHCLIVCLKGDSYWFGRDGRILSLHKFDFSTEKFGCVPLPYHRRYYNTFNITVVREEKLAVLLQKRDEPNSKTEVWLSNRIDETKVVSWSFVLALNNLHDEIEHGLPNYRSFLFDEEKKEVVCCDRWLRRVRNDVPVYRDIIYIIDENSNVTKSVGKLDKSGYLPGVFNYVPSWVQIDQARGSKGKRGIDQAQGSKRKRGG